MDYKVGDIINVLHKYKDIDKVILIKNAIIKNIIERESDDILFVLGDNTTIWPNFKHKDYICKIIENKEQLELIEILYL